MTIRKKTVSVNAGKKNQFRITIPSCMAWMLGLSHKDTIECKLDTETNEITLKKVD